MLARPEPGTRSHIVLWLASKPHDKTYDWESYSECACGQYAREIMGKSNIWWHEFSKTPDGKQFAELNFMAALCSTFGELYERAERTWRRRE
jgi:hypothetical protein